jgi:hypothetical protein
LVDLGYRWCEEGAQEADTMAVGREAFECRYWQESEGEFKRMLVWLFVFLCITVGIENVVGDYGKDIGFVILLVADIEDSFEFDKKCRL